MIRTHAQLEEVAAQRAGGLVAGAEPLEQAGRVEAVLACAAELHALDSRKISHDTHLLGQLAVGAVDDGIADGALLHTLKVLVNVALPQQQAVQDRPVL